MPTNLVAWKCPWNDCHRLNEQARCHHCGTLLEWRDSTTAWCSRCGESRSRVKCRGCGRTDDGGEFVKMS